jgi:chromosome partitioning protein
MRTIAIAAEKGGVGKTTLALNLAVLFDTPGAPSAIVDLDPQRSLRVWFDRREAETPFVIETNAAGLADVLTAAKNDGIGTAILDLAPHDAASMATAIRAADLVVIPCRPNPFDLAAAESTARMCEAIGKPALAVLTQTAPRRGFGRPSQVTDAASVLESYGLKVATAFIPSRVVSATSILAGKGVAELDADPVAAKEYRSLASEIATELA